MSDIKSHIDPVGYKKTRQPDEQYKTLLKRIADTGKPAKSGMDEGSTEVLGAILEYDLSNGFPLVTERDLTKVSTPEAIAAYESDESHRELAGMLKQSIGEIIGFVNGARTQEELEAYGCKFWKPWTGDEAKARKRGLDLGDLGPGSYGAAFHDFPTLEEGGFNQYKVMIEQMKARPELRTHIITPFIPQYISRAPGRQQKVLVVPCHGLQHYNIDVENGEMSLVHFQRSGDLPIGVPFNMVHYALLLIMVAQVTGYKPRKLVHIISNAHIYNQHSDMVADLLSRPAQPFPMLKVDPSVKRFEDFRTEHFSIEGYKAHPPIRMGGTAV
ncbi:thymidylate synthase [Candidatus Saccharibacteria bacterium]|nr:thymidylate synthase [Candidatus Saccharibacteria bacterium]